MKPSAAFEEIDRERKAQGLSALALCVRAKLPYSTWWRAAHGRTLWREGTERKLRAALAGAAAPKPMRSPDLGLVRAAYRLHLVTQASALGLDAGEVLDSRNRQHWKLRALAMWAISVEFNVRGADLARAIGMSKQIVSWNIRQANNFADKSILKKIAAEADRVVAPEAAE